MKASLVFTLFLQFLWLINSEQILIHQMTCGTDNFCINQALLLHADSTFTLTNLTTLRSSISHFIPKDYHFQVLEGLTALHKVSFAPPHAFLSRTEITGVPSDFVRTLAQPVFDPLNQNILVVGYMATTKRFALGEINTIGTFRLIKVSTIPWSIGTHEIHHIRATASLDGYVYVVANSVHKTFKYVRLSRNDDGRESTIGSGQIYNIDHLNGDTLMGAESIFPNSYVSHMNPSTGQSKQLYQVKTVLQGAGKFDPNTKRYYYWDYQPQASPATLYTLDSDGKLVKKVEYPSNPVFRASIVMGVHIFQ